MRSDTGPAQECDKKQPKHVFESDTLDQLNREVICLKISRTKTKRFSAMCRRGPKFHDDSPVHPQYDDKPLTMEELDVAKICNFDFKYGQKFAFDFSDVLLAIDHSLMQSPKSNRHRRRKRRKYPKFRFVPSLEDIKENELFETQLENIKLKKLEKGLTAIHQERALNCGMSIPKHEGRRRDRRKGQSRSSRRKI